MKLSIQVRSFARLPETHRGSVLKAAVSYCHDLHDRAELAQAIAAQVARGTAGSPAPICQGPQRVPDEIARRERE